MLSVIIPAKNEAKRIGATLERLCSFLRRQKISAEVIVVNNGPDSTPEIVREKKKKYPFIRLLDFKTPLGKGRAVREGLKVAKGNALICDADASWSPEEIPKLVSALEHADLAVGSRRSPQSRVYGLPFTRRLASAAFAFFVRLLFGLGVRDTQCGFKAVRRTAYLKMLPLLKVDLFEWDVEFLLVARQLGLRVAEIPVTWHYRKGGTMSLSFAAKMLSGILAIKKRFP
ncbi:MAG: glycosyltransferase [Candidatus Micrarchaeota archaeon]